jgi:hypothetical protein
MEAQPAFGLRLHSHRIDEFATGYSSAGCTPAEPASASPADFIFIQPVGNCKPSPAKGGGFFIQHHEEFSAGIDKESELKFTSRQLPHPLIELGAHFYESKA